MHLNKAASGYIKQKLTNHKQKWTDPLLQGRSELPWIFVDQVDPSLENMDNTKTQLDLVKHGEHCRQNSRFHILHI